MNWLAILNGAFGALLAIAVVWLTSQLAAARGYSDKIWQRKADAYGLIFEALHDIETWFESNLDDEMLRRDVDDAVQSVRNASYRTARERFSRTIAREIWLFTP